MPLFRVILFALTGLVFGSFLTVVIHRVPRKESILLPGSACPGCGVPIRPWDNIPVLSYLLLRGRCRHCGVRISPQYPLVEALTGALFAGAAIVFHRLPVAALVAPFLGLMVAVAFIDARHRVIPNRIVFPSLILFAVAISSWLPPPRYGSPLRGVTSFLHGATDPVLRPVRRFLPPVGTGALRIDLAFIVVLVFVVVLHLSVCGP